MLDPAEGRVQAIEVAESKLIAQVGTRSEVILL